MAGKTRARDVAGTPVPAPFLERMAVLLGDEFDAFVEAYAQPPVQGLRANTLKIGTGALRALLPFNLTPVPWSDDAFIVAPAEGEADSADGAVWPGKHPYHAAGLYYLQDPSALAPVELLDPQPGERVLDLAAAPGGKSTHIAARLQGEGLLVSNEVVHKRAWELAGNLERWGATNVAITTEPPERLAARLPGFFDAVLVDAPCSGEGMFRKSEAARQEWAPSLVEGCAVRQHGILEQAAALVRPGGRLVYSTCTFAPEEDEGTIARFLDEHPEFALVEPPARRGFNPGRPDWAPVHLRRPELTRCVRLWPHLSPGEGHFAALLRKTDEQEPFVQPRLPRQMSRSTRPTKTAQAAYEAFVTETLAGSPTDEPPGLVGSYLYALSSLLPDLTGLRYLHPGWWLGEHKTDRFEPSHAFALGLKREKAREVVDYDVDDPQVQAFLRGETIAAPGGDGWTLVCVQGYPLGWGKRVTGRVKSRYPKGLRWR